MSGREAAPAGEGSDRTVAPRPLVSLYLEGLGRTKTRPMVILKRGVARCDGQLVDPRDGVVLNREEACETVYVPVEEEPLGSVVRTDVRVAPF